jgi:hypothetical protein
MAIATGEVWCADEMCFPASRQRSLGPAMPIKLRRLSTASSFSVVS